MSAQYVSGEKAAEPPEQYMQGPKLCGHPFHRLPWGGDPASLLCSAPTPEEMMCGSRRQPMTAIAAGLHFAIRVVVLFRDAFGGL
eukprot:gene11288-biopygen8193